MSLQRMLVSVLCLSVLGLGATFAGADQTIPYSWEDGGTVLGLYGTGTPPIIATNVPAPDPVFAGLRSLKLEDNSPTGTPQAFVAWINNLTDGDVVSASLWRYDTTPGSPGAPSCRLWAHYTSDPNDINSYVASAGGNSDYGPGTGWDQTGWSWTFDSDFGARNGLLIEVRTYSSAADTVWVDNLVVTAPDTATMMVPEPAALSLLALGAAALIRRRRSR